jgi:hypothetical protein
LNAVTIKQIRQTAQAFQDREAGPTYLGRAIEARLAWLVIAETQPAPVETEAGVRR